MNTLFSIHGSEKKPKEPARIHVLVPYCLKSFDCPCGRDSSECVSCGLCNVGTIVEWALSNSYSYQVLSQTAFFESYLPNNIDSMDVIIGFICNYSKSGAPRVVSQHACLSLILVSMKLSCRKDEIEKTKSGGAKIENHVKDLEQVLFSIEKYLSGDS